MIKLLISKKKDMDDKKDENLETISNKNISTA